MNRSHLLFGCEGEQLAGTLDAAAGSVGLLMVSGGNELRSGAFSGQAQIAAKIAASGFPVFRFDRRGVGDSSGTNGGFRSSGPDLAAALAQFRIAQPKVRRIVGFGICDAASALVLHGDLGLDALILANPWTIEDADALPPPTAIRSRYAQKLRNPAEIWRLLTGKVSLKGLFHGVLAAMAPPRPVSSLAAEVAKGIAACDAPVHLLLAGRDRTAQIFESEWPASDPRIARCPNASHAFAEEESKIWLFNQIIEALIAQTD